MLANPNRLPYGKSFAQWRRPPPAHLVDPGSVSCQAVISPPCPLKRWAGHFPRSLDSPSAHRRVAGVTAVSP